MTANHRGEVIVKCPPYGSYQREALITRVDRNQSKRVGLIQNDGPVLVFPFQFLFEVTPQG